MASTYTADDVIGAMRKRVFQDIKDHDGATCDEIEARLDLRHQTASARVNELYRRGFIQDLGFRRRTRGGRNAIVWKVAIAENKAA